MENTTNKILHILRGNARLTNAQIAAMLGLSENEVRAEITALEESGIIAGYSAIINEEEYDKNATTAVIQLKVSPQLDNGYDAIVRKIVQNSNVEDIRLMSGGNYDLAVTVKCENFRDVATFVTANLAPMDGVLSTATHFILKRYKEKGALFPSDSDDERSLVSP
ncbi:MAG: Lrp/AsnC family transcriptional regulator [Oscillospiraceae bacterium]|nr:Lrp/AsnC family transcriptional regulator [Oscillospiraceae bacterium]